MKNIILSIALLAATLGLSQTSFKVPGSNQVNIMGLDTFALDWITEDFTLVQFTESCVTVRDLSGSPDHEFKWSREAYNQYKDLRIGTIYTFDVKEGQVNRIIEY